MADLLHERIASALGTSFTLERELGGGGMSRVFVARDAALERHVVVKVLSPDLAAGVSAERFTREIKLAAGLQQANIVPLLSAGLADGLPYYTMPFVDGLSLRARLERNGALPVGEAVGVLHDVARALAYAHEHGVVHRDIKPENILLSGDAAVVTDFGIAKALSASKTTAPGGTLTQVGTSIGTPAYMAPEQAAGDPATDHRADLYALGCVAYEMLAGAAPFAGRPVHQLYAAHLTETPAPVGQARPDAPPALAALVMRCLAKDPAKRPQSARELLAALDGVVAGYPSGVGAAIGHAARRRPLLVAVAALAVVAALGVGGFAFARRAGPASAASAASARPALAVLPFEHQGDAADAYLTEGITDEIRGKLTGVHDLVVIARASSNQYRATKKTPQEIAKELGVRYLLSGTVRVVGSGDARRVLVRPELVEVTDGGQPESKWQQPFDAPAADVIKVQSDIAGQVVSAMEVAVTGADQARLVHLATHDPVAYDLYLRGRAAVNFGANVDPASQRAAIPFYEQAVARDSNLVDAWAALVSARALLYANGTRAAQLARETLAAAERVRALDPAGALGHRVLVTYYRLVAPDLPRAIAEAEQAHRLAPNDPLTMGSLAIALDDAGRREESLRYLDESIRLDPRRASGHAYRAQLLLALGRFVDSRAAAERARELAPSSLNPVDALLQVALAQGDRAAAARAFAEAMRTQPEGRVLAWASTFGFDWLLDPAAQRRLAALEPGAFGGDRGLWAMARARCAWWAGDAATRRSWGDSAVHYLRAQVADVPNEPAVLINLAEALAHAGDRAGAVAAARRAVDIARTRFPLHRGTMYSGSLFTAAWSAAAAGDADAAVEWLTELRGLNAGWTSPARLRIDGWFKDVRDDPRFQRLMAASPP